MKRLKVIFLVILSVTVLTSVMPLNASAGSKITECVSILDPRQNIHGNGYEWDNINDTLYLNNLNIETDDEYGLKIPDNCTVVLKGVNKISAKGSAVYIQGDVTVKGDGKLVANGGEYGVLCNATDKRAKLSIISGKYEITAGKDGFHSAIQTVSLSTADITVCAGENAINGQTVYLRNGLKFKAEGSRLKADVSLSIEACDVSVSYKESAILTGDLKITSLDLKAGNDFSSLNGVDTYNGENTIETKSNWKYIKTSFLFGENVSIWADVGVLALAVIVVASIIVVPKLLKKKKLEKIVSAQKEDKLKK